jgi:hypothetical protein
MASSFPRTKRRSLASSLQAWRKFIRRIGVLTMPFATGEQ